MGGHIHMEAKRAATAIASVTGAAGPHNVLSATHSDATTTAATRGDVIIANSSPAWTALAIGAATRFLRSDGTDPSWAAIQAGDVPTLGGMPALTLSTSNGAGGAATYVRTDATLLVFDATVPTTIQPDDAAAAGAASVAARRDHAHAIVCAVAGTIAPDDSAAEGSAGSFARSDHTHAITCAAPDTNLAVATTNAEGGEATFARSDHSHAITSSAAPGAAASLLASDANGYLQLVRLGIGAAPSYLLHVETSSDGEIARIRRAGATKNVGLFITATEATGVVDLAASGSTDFQMALSIGGGEVVRLTGARDVGIGTTGPDAKLDVLDTGGAQLRLTYTDGSVYTDLTVDSGGDLTIAPTGDLVFNPTGNDVLPSTAYDLNIGSLQKKYLTLHVAELWVETLVAQETLATIGGRILVGPTTVLTRDFDAADTTIYVKHNEMANGDRAYLEADGRVEFISIDSAATASAELLSNPGFETAGGGGADIWANWTESAGDGALANETSAKHSGSDAAKVTAGASLNTYVKQAGTVTAGNRYKVDFWTRGDGTYGGRFLVYDATAGADIIALRPTDNNSTTYGRKWVYFHAPVGCSSVEVYLYCPGTNTGIAYFDDVSLSLAEYSYTVTRDLDGTGANDWNAGDAVFNTGAAGDGFIDLYSVHGVKAATEFGPTIVGNVRNSGTYNDWTEHWAIGNLNGVYGYSATAYGAAFGKYSAADYITIDATNGIRFLDSADTVQGQLSSAAWTLGEVGAAKSNVHITAGAIQLRTNATVNIQLDASGNASFGNVAANQGNMYWNNANKRAEFRGGAGGTVVQAYVDTDGSIVAGGGEVTLNTDGVGIAAGAATANFVHWDDGATTVASVVGQHVGNNTYISLLAYNPDAGGDGVANITASSPTNVDTKFQLVGTDAGTPQIQVTVADTTQGFWYNGYLKTQSGVDIRCGGGLSVGLNTNDPVANTLWVEDYGAFEGGVHVGGTSDPGTDVLIVDGMSYINDSANAKMTLGLTINQGANDDEILALKSSDVAHGITDDAETDTYGTLQKHDATAGGLRISGFRDADGSNDGAITLWAELGEAVSTTKSAAGWGVVNILTEVKSGTAGAAPGANGNLVSIGSSTSVRFIFDQEGEMHSDDVIGVGDDWDEWDDLRLAADLSRLPQAKWHEMMRYDAQDFEKAGLLTLSTDEDGTQHAFLRHKALLQFYACCFREVGQRLGRYEQALIGLGVDLARLEVD
jgi:hypothetical protein